MLSCTTAFAGQSNGSVATQALPSAAPTLPYVDRTGYHAIQLGPWRLKAPALMFGGADANAPIVSNLPTGASVRALKVEVHTLRPAVCEAIQDGALTLTQWSQRGSRVDTRDVKVPFRRGDRVYELGYYEEGTCSVWFKRGTGLAECGMNGLSGGQELCRYVGPGKPVTEVWAFVTASTGQRGWLRNPKAAGMSRHD